MFRVLGEAVRRCRSRGGVLGGWQGGSERGRCMWELWRALLASGRVDNRLCMSCMGARTSNPGVMHRLLYGECILV